MRKSLMMASLLIVQVGYGQIQQGLPKYVHVMKSGDTSYSIQRLPVASGITPLIERYYKDAQECTMLFIGFRFRVDKLGKVFEAVCSINTPKFLEDTLLKNLEKTSGHWIPQKVNGVAVDSKPLLLLYYIYIDIATMNCDDTDLFEKANLGLPALEFAAGKAEEESNDVLIDGTIYKPTYMRISIFPKGYVR